MKGGMQVKKGKRFEKWCAEQIEEMGLGSAGREIGSGSGKAKGDIRANLPFLLECKNQKTLAWWKSIDQSRQQARKGNWDGNKWALIVRDPRTPEETTDAYALIDYHEFLKLLKKDREPLVKEPSHFSFFLRKILLLLELSSPYTIYTYLLKAYTTFPNLLLLFLLTENPHFPNTK